MIFFLFSLGGGLFVFMCEELLTGCAQEWNAGAHRLQPAPSSLAVPEAACWGFWLLREQVSPPPLRSTLVPVL